MYLEIVVAVREFDFSLFESFQVLVELFVTHLASDNGSQFLILEILLGFTGLLAHQNAISTSFWTLNIRTKRFTADLFATFVEAFVLLSEGFSSPYEYDHTKNCQKNPEAQIIFLQENFENEGSKSDPSLLLEILFS